MAIAFDHACDFDHTLPVVDGMLIAVAASIYFLRKQKELLLALLWFIASMALVVLGSLTKPWWFLIIEPYWLTFALFGFCMALAFVVLKHHWKWLFIIMICICWVSLIRIYNAIWTDEKAYSYYSLSCFPGYNEMHWKLARVYEREGNWRMAEYHNKISLTEHPQDTFNFLQSQALLKIKERDFASAKGYLDQALHLSPRSAILLTNRGVVSVAEGKMEEAKQYFLSASSMDSHDLISRLNLCALYRRDKAYPQSIRFGQEVLAIDPSNDAAMAEMIQAYIALNDRPGIMKMCRLILSHSKNPLFLENAHVLMRQMGGPEHGRQ